MTKATRLVNNGLPAGISMRDVEVGDIVNVKFDDVGSAVPMLITENGGSYKKITYKGYLSYEGLFLCEPGKLPRRLRERNRLHNFEADMIQSIHTKYEDLQRLCSRNIKE